MGNNLKLPYMEADPNSITVSGHSMGCYMSHLMSVIESQTIKGAGLFECWPYGAFPNYLPSYTSEQLANYSIDLIEEAESRDEIDDTSNLEERSFYIFSGGDTDELTPPRGQQALKIIYENYEVTKLTYVDEDVGHFIGRGHMIPGLKQIYVDLGYASDLEDFEDIVD